MKLLVDLGNTALKWACAADGVAGPALTVVHRDGGDWSAALTAAWRALGTTQAVGCSVAAVDTLRAVEQAASASGIALCWLRAESAHNGGVELANGYREPAQLGPDRWHAMLGACGRHPQRSLLLATAGTATTVDCVAVVGGRARFVGGCIAPGSRLMLEALATRTAGLPQASGSAVDFPDNTDDAIATGVTDAQAGLVMQLAERFAQRLGHTPLLLVSGGDAEALAARLRGAGAAPLIEHNLVLAGLALRAAALLPDA
jgi:type III pantothenate kinase